MANMRTEIRQSGEKLYGIEYSNPQPVYTTIEAGDKYNTRYIIQQQENGGLQIRKITDGPMKGGEIVVTPHSSNVITIQ